MASDPIWVINMRTADQADTAVLGERFRRLHLIGAGQGVYVPTVRLAVRCLLELADDDILVLAARVAGKRGELT